MMTTKCPECGEFFEAIGTHWRYNPEHRPDFTQEQSEIITGVLMGDGSVTSQGSRNPKLQIEMINREYLNYLDKCFGCLSKGVSMTQTAKESAKDARMSGLNTNAKSQNYSNMYKLYSVSHPSLDEFLDWYSNIKKVWPELKVTPTILKHWYCCDGTYDNTHSHNRIQIGANNESSNKDKIKKIFRLSDLPEPKLYDNRKSFKIVFNVEKSKTLFKYMGSPPPGFEYKWP